LPIDFTAQRAALEGRGLSCEGGNKAPGVDFVHCGRQIAVGHSEVVAWDIKGGKVTDLVAGVSTNTGQVDALAGALFGFVIDSATYPGGSPAAAKQWLAHHLGSATEQDQVFEGVWVKVAPAPADGSPLMNMSVNL
jgi:hypothetical protein